MKTTLSIVLFLLSCGVASAQVKSQSTTQSSQKHGSDGTPLYVFFANSKEVSRSADTAGLHDINPQDIESVSVLKDSTATKKYGSKAKLA